MFFCFCEMAEEKGKMPQIWIYIYIHIFFSCALNQHGLVIVCSLCWFYWIFFSLSQAQWEVRRMTATAEVRLPQKRLSNIARGGTSIAWKGTHSQCASIAQLFLYPKRWFADHFCQMMALWNWIWLCFGLLPFKKVARTETHEVSQIPPWLIKWDFLGDLKFKS